MSGCRLLTTAQNSEFRVYEAPDWSRAKLIIKHPHRHFQHLTSIKAQWHPLHDLIVIGRYPDPNLKTNDPINDQRTIDVYDGITGRIVCQLLDPSAPGIVSVRSILVPNPWPSLPCLLPFSLNSFPFAYLLLYAYLL